MQGIMNQLITLAKAKLADKTVTRVIGWRNGLFEYDVTPSVFTEADDIDKNFVYNQYCSANLSKYMVKESRKEGKILVFLKPCDTYSFNQLLKEYRILRDNVYVVGIPCEDFVDIKEGGTKDDAIPSIRCKTCKSKKHVVYDELIGEDGQILDSNRFDQVQEIEKMTSEERFAFWRKQLSRCIRCNACRNVCPACTCEQCVFDNPKSGIAQKAASDSFEENNFHIIRAFHVAGRCTDCGECSRVCPQNIPLHLLNRKFIKDINEIYGDYQAGENFDEKAPLNRFEKNDAEPSIVYSRNQEAK